MTFRPPGRVKGSWRVRHNRRPCGRHLGGAEIARVSYTPRGAVPNRCAAAVARGSPPSRGSTWRTPSAATASRACGHLSIRPGCGSGGRRADGQRVRLPVRSCSHDTVSRCLAGWSRGGRRRARCDRPRLPARTSTRGTSDHIEGHGAGSWARCVGDGRRDRCQTMRT